VRLACRIYSPLACLIFWGLLFVLLMPGSRAQEPPVDLTQVGIEHLMKISVTSASKKEQQLLRTPSAIYVISSEDIRRSGASSIPEILRMVPGLQVARIGSSSWAISARGFNDQFANMMLVLIDGRTVYTPLFAGVYWDVQDVMMEDVERIEVIRGPGATIWGANAVNGVINIITRHSAATAGALLTAEAGTEDRSGVSARYGGTAGPNGHYRVFAKYFDRAGLAEPSGRSNDTAWNMIRGGFRTDWQLSKRDSITFQGDIYQGDENSSVDIPSLDPPYAVTRDYTAGVAGGNLLARWTRSFNTQSNFTLQAYYDITQRRTFLLGEHRHTLDLDFQHRLPIGTRHDVVWGLGYSATEASLRNSFTISFHPARPVDRRYGSFVQDEISILRDRLSLTVGMKLEHNPYSGFEKQPTARLAWTPNRRQLFWVAASRAARTPSPGDTAMRTNTAVFPGNDRRLNIISILGSPDFGSQYLNAYEGGYRVRANEKCYFDLATFYNRHAKLKTSEPGSPVLEADPSPPHLLIPIYYENMMHAESYGAELIADWEVTRRWNLSAGYSHLRIFAHTAAGSRDNSSAGRLEGQAPRHHFDLRSHLHLARNLEFDSAVSRIGALTGPAVPAHTRLDTRIGWRAGEHWEISAGGQNLLSAHHLEFDARRQGIRLSYVRRAFYGKVSWRL